MSPVTIRLVRHRYGTSIVAVFLLTTVVRAQEASFEGQRIASVVFEPEKQPLERRELDEVLPVKPGQIYAAADIRAAIERLFATGRFQDIQVDASGASDKSGEGGVTVKFITKNSWFVGKVSASEDFAEPPNPGQIVNASRLQLGVPFDAAQIPAAVENIRAVVPCAAHRALPWVVVESSAVSINFAARCTARRMRICVPQRHRCGSSSARICSSVGLEFLCSSACARIIIPLIQ